MGFKLNKSDTFTWPVEILVPRNGKHDVKKCKGEFEFMDQSDIDGLDDRELLDKVLVGWDNFTDVEGVSIEYNDENREQVINTPFARLGFTRAYVNANNGDKRRRKT